MKEQIWKNDNELFALIKKKLFVALVGDILDQEGYTNQFLPPKIKPISDKMIILGRAMPVLEADFFTDDIKSNYEASNKTFGYMFEALDSLKENEIYICSGSSFDYALWGGLMSTRAIKCGSSGAVLNGYHRDTDEIKRLNFPLASCGGYAKDQNGRGKVIDFRVPIKFGDVIVNNGDIVYGDLDGILIVPKKVENDIFQKAFEKAKTEKIMLKALEKGMSSCEAFEKFGSF